MALQLGEVVHDEDRVTSTMKKKARLGLDAEQGGNGAVVRLWHWSARRKRSARWCYGAKAR